MASGIRHPLLAHRSVGYLCSVGFAWDHPGLVPGLAHVSLILEQLPGAYSPLAHGIFSPDPWQMPRRPNQTVQTLPKPLLTSCLLTFHWPMQPSVAVVGMYTPSLSARHHKAMWQGVGVDTGDSVPSTTLPEAPLNLPGLDHSLT